ncbi:MAG: hypothetical protein OEV21_04020, partial [Thermoplasmata archaeon]|nr:hypothetical protein [Thermoplasmata archaeon]
MNEDKVKKEHNVLSTLPVVTGWIKENKQLEEKDIETLQKLFPKQFQYALEVSLEELIDMNNRYRDSKLYGKHVEILLSPSGIQWLREHYD